MWVSVCCLCLCVFIFHLLRKLIDFQFRVRGDREREGKWSCPSKLAGTCVKVIWSKLGCLWINLHKRDLLSLQLFKGHINTRSEERRCPERRSICGCSDHQGSWRNLSGEASPGPLGWGAREESLVHGGGLGASLRAASVVWLALWDPCHWSWEGRPQCWSYSRKRIKETWAQHPAWQLQLH